MASNLILLKSEEGQKLLSDCKAGNGCLYQIHLHSIFNKQVGSNACGIASSSMILSAPYAAKESTSDRSKLPYIEGNMFDHSQTLSVITKEKLNGEPGGMTLDEVTRLFEAHGCHVKKVHAGDDMTKGVEEFREDVRAALSHTDSRVGLVVNYHMDVLGQGCPYGHFSPVGAYHAATDRVLILDTWIETEECWATIHDLYVSMNTEDDECRLKRGYVIVTVNPGGVA